MSENLPVSGTRHIVRRGETLFLIAEQNGTTLNALLAANPDITNPNLILVGQEIIIPAEQTTDDSAAPVEGHDGGQTLEGDPNGILEEFESGGASAITAAQDHLNITGREASARLAATDRVRVMRHKARFIEAGRRFNLPPAILAAIASRETRGGNVLDSNGEGDHGNAFGVMQVDKRFHSVIRTGGPFGQPHINQATGILRRILNEVRDNFPDLSEAQQLQTAVSRYNGGARLPAPRSDVGTTGGDYMNDVWARARFYAGVENFNAPAADSSTPAVAEPVTETSSSASTAATQPGGFVIAPLLGDALGGSGILEFGHEGDAVRHVQLLLGQAADGKFGRRTRSAVINFQREHRIAVSPGNEGKVDSATLAAIEDAFEADLAAVAPIDARHKTDRIHPQLRKRLGQLAGGLVARGMQALITDGLRTFEEQHAIFLIGRRGIPGERKVTNADAGRSNHNYGLAVDLYPVINGRVFTDIPHGATQAFRDLFRATQQAIVDEAERLGLTSGIHFTSLVDTPHVQLFGEDVLRPGRCLEIFRANDNDLNAVWAEASRML